MSESSEEFGDNSCKDLCVCELGNPRVVSSGIFTMLSAVCQMALYGFLLFNMYKEGVLQHDDNLMKSMFFFVLILLIMAIVQLGMQIPLFIQGVEESNSLRERYCAGEKLQKKNCGRCNTKGGLQKGVVGLSIFTSTVFLLFSMYYLGVNMTHEHGKTKNKLGFEDVDKAMKLGLLSAGDSSIRRVVAESDDDSESEGEEEESIAEFDEFGDSGSESGGNGKKCTNCKTICGKAVKNYCGKVINQITSSNVLRYFIMVLIAIGALASNISVVAVK